MKMIKTISRFAVLLMLMFSFTACVDFGDINIDPDAAADAPPEALMPVIQARMAWYTFGDGARYPGIFTQHYQGIANQHLSFADYDFFPDDCVNIWRSIYNGAFRDMGFMNEKIAEDPAAFSEFTGVGKILEAYWLGTATDLFGDIPYSEAGAGNDNLTPKYDSQESIYAAIFTLLDGGIAALANAGERSVAGSDYIFGGDRDKWIKLAHMLKARYSLHKIKRDAGSAQAALDAIAAGGMASSADDADFVFSDGEGNPLSQWKTNRTGDALLGKAFVDLMNSKLDPRLPFLADTVLGGIYAGSPLSKDGVDAGASNFGPYWSNSSTPVPFGSYMEQKFIEAEALVRTSGAGAEQALKDAVQASMDRMGVDATEAATYVATVALAGTMDDMIKTVIEEKYVALNNNHETWTDYRRTGYPVLESATGDLADMPRRLPYSQEEQLYNNANMPRVSLTDRMWWDQ